METTEINNRNEAIAVFMGGQFKTDLDFKYTKSGWFDTPANKNNHVVQSNEFKYHLSMDWLYPVCQKIGDMSHEIPISTYMSFIKIQNALNNIKPVFEIFIHVSDFAMEYQKLKLDNNK